MLDGATKGSQRTVCSRERSEEYFVGLNDIVTREKPPYENQTTQANIYLLLLF